MNKFLKIVAGTILSFCFFTSTFAKETYLYDLVKNNPYKTIWNQTMRPIPKDNIEWMKNANGVSTPVSLVGVNGIKYYKGWICEPHNCDMNSLYVLINKNKMVAVLFTKNTMLTNKAYIKTYGSPSPAELEYIMDWQHSY